MRSHFPPESYVCDDLDNDRHPMNHPASLWRFRVTLRNLFAPTFRLSEDHLLRRILLVLCDLPDPDEDSAWDVSMDETREGPEVLAEVNLHALVVVIALTHHVHTPSTHFSKQPE